MIRVRTWKGQSEDSFKRELLPVILDFIGCREKALRVSLVTALHYMTLRGAPFSIRVIAQEEGCRVILHASAAAFPTQTLYKHLAWRREHPRAHLSKWRRRLSSILSRILSPVDYAVFHLYGRQVALVFCFPIAHRGRGAPEPGDFEAKFFREQNDVIFK